MSDAALISSFGELPIEKQKEVHWCSQVHFVFQSDSSILGAIIEHVM